MGIKERPQTNTFLIIVYFQLIQVCFILNLLKLDTVQVFLATFDRTSFLELYISYQYTS